MYCVAATTLSYHFRFTAIGFEKMWKERPKRSIFNDLSLDVAYTIPTPVIGKLAEAIIAKINERDLEAMLENLKDVMEHATPGVDLIDEAS